MINTYAAYNNAEYLQGYDTASMIGAISQVVLGDFGALFVCISVTFACLATATALADVSATYFNNLPLLKKLPRSICVAFVLLIMLAMSLIGFSGIMRIALPILNYLYPGLIILSLINILLVKRKAMTIRSSVKYQPF